MPGKSVLWREENKTHGGRVFAEKRKSISKER
jgi:hypothetical protein